MQPPPHIRPTKTKRWRRRMQLEQEKVQGEDHLEDDEQLQ
jgi:hypothetical protein